jgi:hypothetical protein
MSAPAAPAMKGSLFSDFEKSCIARLSPEGR